MQARAPESVRRSVGLLVLQLRGTHRGAQELASPVEFLLLGQLLPVHPSRQIIQLGGRTPDVLSSSAERAPPMSSILGVRLM